MSSEKLNTCLKRQKQNDKIPNLSKSRQTANFSNGFTIVELLVVIVVIGILASITMVSYGGITLKATNAVLQSDLKNASTVLEMDKTTNGTYPATKEAANGGKGLQPSPGTIFDYTYTSVDDSYSLVATNNSISYYVTSASQAPIAGTPTGGAQAMVWGQISAGIYNTCAIANGQAYYWGYNDHGELGNSTTNSSSIPVPVDVTGALTGKTVTAISVGDDHTCAIANNQAYCWGYNSNGELGNNTIAGSSIPLSVDTTGALAGKTVTAISAGHKQYGSHTCAIANSQAYCWGSGPLGDNTTNRSLIPVPVDTTGVLAGKTVTAISVGNTHTCAIANSQAYCWGSGPLGDNTTNRSLIPVPVDTTGVLAGKTVTAITAGGAHTCAIANSQAYCWGDNYYGQLGNNTTNDSSVPVPVDMSGALAGKTVTAITAGNTHTCAIASGQAYCWGYNQIGQLGNNAATESPNPVPVPVDANVVLASKTVTAIAASSHHACAIADGQSYCWGYNNHGQLGNNSTVNSLVPVAASM